MTVQDVIGNVPAAVGHMRSRLLPTNTEEVHKGLEHVAKYHIWTHARTHWMSHSALSVTCCIQVMKQTQSHAAAHTHQQRQLAFEVSRPTVNCN